jgi:hypothetical protein
MHPFLKAAGVKNEQEFYSKYPSEEHFFAAHPHMKNGGAASGHPGSYWNGEQWVSTAGDSGTFSGGTYFANGGSYSKMGGPTFMPGGSAPIFKMGGGTASFNISNNEYPTPFAMAPGIGKGSGYLQDLPTHMAFGGITPGAEIVNPFAMNPGTGKGGGMLQDLPVEMKKGGKHHKSKKLSPAQMQMMMAAMQQQPQGMPQGMPMGMAPQGMSPQDQQMMAMQQAQGQGQQPMMSPQDQQAMMMQQQGGGQPMQPGMMKKGGIYIKPSKRGTFTAAASKHGKSVQAFASQVLAHKENYSPAMVKKANFARNAAKWHHEFGGPAMPDNPGFRALPASVQQKIMDNMQTGGMVTADRMVYMPGGTYQQGGQTNEYANMAIGQMNQMQHKIGELGQVLNQNTHVEPWVASKMTLANDYLNSIENYLEHNPEAQQHMMQGGQFPSFEAYGGYVNPFHPLAKFMAHGGYYQRGGDTSIKRSSRFGVGDYEDPTEMPTDPVSAPTGQDDQTAASTDVVTMPQEPTATWNKGMTDYGQGSIGTYNPNTGNTIDGSTNWGQNISKWAQTGEGLFNTALNLGKAYTSIKDAKKQAEYRQKKGQTINAFAAVNQPGGHGDYTPNQGLFRPDSYIPVRAGYFPPSMGKYGGTFMMGGMPMRDTAYATGGYVPGSVHEVDDAEIARLRKLGYEVEMM